MPGKRVTEVRVVDYRGEVEAEIRIAPGGKGRAVEVTLTPKQYTALANAVHATHWKGQGYLRPFLCNYVGWVWQRVRFRP